MRYIVLPVTAKTLDEALLKRFGDEIAMAGNRPLYFFDTDGACAAVLWYVHLVVVEGLDEASAAKEVEEIGPKEADLWMAATAFLKARQKATQPPDAEKTAVPAPTDPTPAAEETPKPVAIAPALVASPLFQDTTAWRPFAALLLTALSVPLAFAGRSALSHAVGSVARRASLSAPVRPSRSLPAESGE